MVSWIYAFKRGLYIWLWAILWGIIGGIIAIVISGGSILAIVINPSAFTSATSQIAAVGGIFLGVIVGALVAAIGNYAAIVKITLESVEETKKPAQKT